MLVEFIDKWQTLIGSAIGPFLAIILSFVAFYVKRKYQKIAERKESIRRAEINFSQILNYIFVLVDQLEDFIKRVEIIICEIKEDIDSKEYALDETNFFPITSNCFDKNLSKMKFGSLYLHNQILFIEFLTEHIYSAIIQFKDDFDKLLQKNQFICANRGEVHLQRETYIINLESFIKMVKYFLNSLKKKDIRCLAQAKVYNRKLMKEYFSTLWKHESVSFKYFKTRNELIKYKNINESFSRINSLIEDDVNKLIDETKEAVSKEDG